MSRIRFRGRGGQDIADIRARTDAYRDKTRQ
jgi:hypothetical protein